MRISKNLLFEELICNYSSHFRKYAKSGAMVYAALAHESFTECRASIFIACYIIKYHFVYIIRIRMIIIPAA